MNALELEIQDVQDARKMQELTHDWVPKFIIVSVTLSLVGSLILFFVWPIPTQNKDLIIGLMVLLGWQFLNSCRFYLGGNAPSFNDIEKLRGK